MAGTLDITVISGRNIDNNIKGKLYLNFWVDDFKKLTKKTAHKNKTDSPKWDQNFQIPLTSVSSSSVVHFELWDTEKEDSAVATVDVSLENLINNVGEEKQVWHSLKPGGEIEIKLLWNTSDNEKKETVVPRVQTAAATGILKKKNSLGQQSMGSATERVNRSQSARKVVAGSPKVTTARGDRKDRVKTTKLTRVEMDSVPMISITLDDEVKPRVYPLPPNIEIVRKDLKEVNIEAWPLERKCLLMLLEARVILREIIEEKVSTLKIPAPASPPPAPAAKKPSGGMSVEIRRLLAINPDDEDEDSDLATEIAELRKQIVLQIRENQKFERDLSEFERKISLLIMNRSSIAELDRNAKKKKKKGEGDIPLDNENQILNDTIRMALYSNLFYLLQTQPKYLARLARVVPQQKMDTFIETIILTLFGDAFSPREEFLMLTLFKLAIQQEIIHLTSVKDLTQADSVVPKMIIAYNKRKQGKDYLLKTLTVPVTAVIDGNYKFDSEVDFEKALDSFFNAIVNSIATIPYGFRLICKQISEFMRLKFSEITEEELGQIFGFYIYFKFLNPSIVDPSETGILNQDQVNMAAITNLTKVARVLQALFDLRTIPKGEESKFNGWIKLKIPAVLSFFNDLINVPPPEDYLQVDKYTELYSKQQPIIMIRLREISDMHQLISNNLEEILEKDKNTVTEDKEDPLRTILRELGPDVPRISESSTTDAQLSLKNRFGSRLEQELNDNAELFDSTKELIIKVFRVTPTDQASSQMLPDILDFAKTYAKQNQNSRLEKFATEALENVIKLEKHGLISADDNYQGFLKSVAAEISNRAVRREQQQKEIIKLRTALRELKNHQKFVSDRITDLERYLESCRDNLSKKVKNKKSKNKFSYKQLVKEGVIAESDVPEASRAKTVFFITMPELGIFNIEVKIGGIPVPTSMKPIELEDLLAKKDRGESKLELDKITLNVNPTIILMNKHFLS